MITVRPNSPVAPYEQIRQQLRDQIRAGQLTGGQRLPSIRQLAADLWIAPGTVAKAYATLEQDGLLQTSRTHGTRVVSGQTHDPDTQRAAAAFIASVGHLDLGEVLSATRGAWLANHGNQ